MSSPNEDLLDENLKLQRKQAIEDNILAIMNNG